MKANSCQKETGADYFTKILFNVKVSGHAANPLRHHILPTSVQFTPLLAVIGTFGILVSL